MRGNAIVCVCIFAAAALLHAPAGAGVIATFENYPEGWFDGTSTTDTVTGMTFSAAPVVTNRLCVEYADSPTPQDAAFFHKNKYLSSGGYSPGSGGGVPGNFDLTIGLPAPAAAVSFDIGYVYLPWNGPGSVDVYAYNAADVQIAQNVVTYSTYTVWQQATLSISAPTGETMTRVFVDTTNVPLAYDNISFTPEPGLCGAIAAAALLPRRRR